MGGWLARWWKAQIELESDFRYDSFITILINSTIIISFAIATTIVNNPRPIQDLFSTTRYLTPTTIQLPPTILGRNFIYFYQINYLLLRIIS